MTPSPPLAAETLLAHEGFVRALARRLVHGDADVDDVVQQTFVAALGSPPRDGEAARGWFAVVVRNVVRQRHRAAARRARRERSAARPEGVPSAADVLAREAARRTVIDAVLALEEPYRGAIVLRYLEALPPREVAARLGVPVETARTRVKRGLARLRERLDAQHGGDRRAWAVLFLPLAGPAPGAPRGRPAVPVAAGGVVAALVVGLGLGGSLGGGGSPGAGAPREVPSPGTGPSVEVGPDGGAPGTPAPAWCTLAPSDDGTDGGAPPGGAVPGCVPVAPSAGPAGHDRPAADGPAADGPRPLAACTCAPVPPPVVSAASPAPAGPGLASRDDAAAGPRVRRLAFLEDGERDRTVAEVEAEGQDGAEGPRLVVRASAVGARVGGAPGPAGVAGGNTVTAEELGALLQRGAVALVEVGASAGAAGPAPRVQRGAVTVRRFTPDGRVVHGGAGAPDGVVGVELRSAALRAGPHAFEVRADGRARVRVVVAVRGGRATVTRLVQVDEAGAEVAP